MKSTDAPSASLARGAGWTLLVAATAVVVALTLAAAVARYNWVLELATHFRAHYAAALGLAAPIFLLGRRFAIAAIAGALAAWNFWYVAPLYFASTSDGRPVATRPIHIVSANVFRWSTDHLPAVHYLRDNGADLVLLIEITPEWAESLEALRSRYPTMHVFAREDSFGLALLSRVPLDAVEVEESSSGVPLVIARLTIDGRPLAVIGAHPPPPISASAAQRRNEALVHLATVVRRQSGPRIVAGDLNITSWSPYFQDLVRETRLIDSRLGRGIQPTWQFDFPFIAPPALRLPIDHCLVSEDITIIDRHVGPFIESDHLPIEVRFTIHGQKGRGGDETR
ncbi:MAG TPA: endonuclease/exonuclease/phosphatase family protein [Pirellulales bacterium]|jgi:endonuclease/exonuclease/phosphatase (EEP) superfamily protein YafD|nr:endonuclease/exonuclease/phosphatase family protein [Pirellulales bacterium]